MSTKESKVKESTAKERKNRHTIKTEKSEVQSGSDHNKTQTMSSLWSADAHPTKVNNLYLMINHQN